jgi:hypothetical protein
MGIISTWLENVSEIIESARKGVLRSDLRFACILEVGDGLDAPNVKMCPSDQ